MNNLLILETAIKEIGVKEDTRAGKNNPRIELYHLYANLSNTNKQPDSVFWCASFICWVLENCGLKSTNSMSARRFERFGIDSSTNPLPGDIWVKHRNGKSSGQGHVGILLKFTKDFVWVLGGNQNDEVNVTMYSRSNETAIRRAVQAPISLQARESLKKKSELLLAGKINQAGKVA
jgi:uncharacterized protein (TIGR02594 family)